MSIIVYTCCLGGFDTIRPPLAIEPGVRYICFTDVPVLPDCPPWEFRPAHLIQEYEEPMFGTNGHLGADLARSSRVPKILPHLILPECDYSIWHDSNFQLAKLPTDIIGELLRFDDWAAHKHPARDCIYAEADILLKENIGTRSLVESEIATLRSLGYPEHNGLWANGMLVRRHSPAVAKLNESWWGLFSAGCERDQISFPVALHRSGISINTIQNDVFRSPYMQFRWHAAWKDQYDNVSVREERARTAAKVKRLEDVAEPGGYRWLSY
jgi:hypothetical protein